MIKEPQKPVREDYLKSVNLYYLNKFWGHQEILALNSFMVNKPICWNCNGSGKVKDTTQRCPVEGLKYADLIPCRLCVGGIMPMEYILKCYKEDLAYYREKVLAYKKDLRIYNSIMWKLTPEEIEYLKK